MDGRSAGTEAPLPSRRSTARRAEAERNATVGRVLIGSMVGAVLYAVTVEPANRDVHRDVLPFRETVEAVDKDTALNSVESDFRRQHPNVGEIRSRVVRLRPRGETREPADG